MISQETLKTRLRYDKKTGVFTWKSSGPNRHNTRQGLIAGYLAVDGYVKIRVEGFLLGAHRWAFLYVTGAIPDCVDHKNGDRGCNVFSNLRPADNYINSQNSRRAKRCNLSTGVLGVTAFGSKTNPYTAAIRVGGKRKHLGHFKTPELAHAAYVAAKRKYHPGCTI